jgi:hypothetical protein
MGRIREAFNAVGLEPVDVPKAFVVHELMGMSFVAATWMVRTASAPAPARDAPKDLDGHQCVIIPLPNACAARWPTLVQLCATTQEGTLCCDKAYALAQACYAMQPSRVAGRPLSHALLRMPAGRRALIAYHRSSRKASQQVTKLRVRRTLGHIDAMMQRPCALPAQPAVWLHTAQTSEALVPHRRAYSCRCFAAARTHLA